MSLLRDFLFGFVGKFWNKHPPPPVEMPSARHWLPFHVVLMLRATLIYILIFTTTLNQSRKPLRQRGVFHLENENIQFRTLFKITLNSLIYVCLFYGTFFQY